MEIPGPKLITKNADVLTQGPYKFLSYVFPDFVPIHMIFPESIINFPRDIPESAPKLNVFVWLITFYRIPLKFFPNIVHI